MGNEKFQKMKIIVSNKGIYRYDNTTFSGIATNDDFKIYIIKEKKEIIYVGMTKQSIGSRFRGSFYAYLHQKDKDIFNGYSGYKWIEDYQNNKKSLDLYLFNILEFEKDPPRIKEFVEAIEEIVYLVRSSGKQKWPEYQHEIHFHNIPEAKKIAKNIYNEVL